MKYSNFIKKKSIFNIKMKTLTRKQGSGFLKTSSVLPKDSHTKRSCSGEGKGSVGCSGFELNESGFSSQVG